MVFWKNKLLTKVSERVLCIEGASRGECIFVVHLIPAESLKSQRWQFYGPLCFPQFGQFTGYSADVAIELSEERVLQHIHRYTCQIPYRC